MSNIVLSNVCKSIKKVEILKNISISFEPGKIYGLRGKNGCGKTMLMRAISGLIYIDSGTVEIDGKILHKDIDFPPNIGALIENPSFVGKYTGYKNLKMLATLKSNVSEQDVFAAIERVGLSDNKNKQYRKYSLGMKQKLGIAYAILGEPDIIILDEPINALDEESVKRIKNVLIELKDKGKTIIVACHDKEELEYLADYIYEMREGECIGLTEVAKS